MLTRWGLLACLRMAELDQDLSDEEVEEPEEPDAPDDLAVHLGADGKPKIIEIRFKVEPESNGLRLDLYLKRRIRRLSRTRIQDIVRTQLTGPGGRRMKPHSPVFTGDELLIERPARPEPVCPREFGVLHDEEDFVVVDKPAGLPVHATARYYFNTLTRLISERWPGRGLQIAHRLDRETSGCLVVARGREVASKIKGAFEQRKVEKRYLALVTGVPEWDEREVDLPLAIAEAPHDADPSKPMLKIRMAPTPGGLSAVTRFSVISRHRDCALVSCKPITGRQHQIRAHLAAIGHAIVGDKLYGHGDAAFVRFCDDGPRTTEALEAEFGMARQALHAAMVRFPHPRTGQPFEIESPLPPDFRAYLATR
jgi:23S rRNA pseudouridine1911/1915/1917 synthase